MMVTILKIVLLICAGEQCTTTSSSSHRHTTSSKYIRRFIFLLFKRLQGSFPKCGGHSFRIDTRSLPEMISARSIAETIHMIWIGSATCHCLQTNTMQLLKDIIALPCIILIICNLEIVCLCDRTNLYLSSDIIIIIAVALVHNTAMRLLPIIQYTI